MRALEATILLTSTKWSKSAHSVSVKLTTSRSRVMPATSSPRTEIRASQRSHSLRPIPHPKARQTRHLKRPPHHGFGAIAFPWRRYSLTTNRERKKTMLINSADDISKRLSLLEDLQNSPVLDAWKNKLCVAGLRHHGLYDTVGVKDRRFLPPGTATGWHLS
jgi:hypothetical protein